MASAARIALAAAGAACVALAAAGAAQAGPAAASPVPAPANTVVRASLSQAGRSLIVSLRTTEPVALRRLPRLPRFARPRANYLCLALRRAAGSHEKRLCLGGRTGSRRRIGLTRLRADGSTIATSTLPATVKRPAPAKLVVTLIPGEAGLTPRRYAWRALMATGGCGPAHACMSRFPAAREGTFRLRPVRAVGCTGGSAGLVRHGSRERKVVALTFDDGPSAYTSGFLSVLRRKHVNGTFFEIGQEMAGNAGLMRRILAQGNEIGNHTMHHGFYPGYADLAATSARIERLTHFRPCLFRPPGGGYNSSVVAAAGAAGMKTIIWDVDPVDWSTPGSGAVYSRVVGAARPGSIILMHDGGGPRGGTLAALPAIIDTLRARGYRFATVSALLGKRMIYRPYG
ncbi:MAG: polysaccharide deacetylase family protein [Solirubrobacterales bacterium]